jgi:hypothetical protein
VYWKKVSINSLILQTDDKFGDNGVVCGPEGAYFAGGCVL